MKAFLILFFFVCCPFACHPCLAGDVSSPLENPLLEKRVRHLCELVKCPTCKGQGILDSNASMATRLQHFIRERVAEGKTDEEILENLVALFGEEILFCPTWEPHNWILWLGPLIFILGGGVLLRRRLSRCYS